MNLRVYVGCALTHAPQDFKDGIELFKKRLREIEWIEVLDFITPNSTLQNPDPGHIYYNDIHECVGTAHVLVADICHASLGLGYELGTSAEKHKIPVLMYAPKNCRISQLPIGAAQRNDHVTFSRYQSSILDSFDEILDELKSIHSQLQLQKNR